MNRPDVQALLLQLGTDEAPHSGRTLREHLEGTARLLEAWGNPEVICLGGLFHSIYGTEVYRIASATLEQRGLVRERIGERAEELAYLFGACDRVHLFGNVDRGEPFALRDCVRDAEVPLDRPTLAALLEIEAANILDQLPPVDRLEPDRLDRWRERWRGALPYLSAGAVRSLDAYFGGLAAPAAARGPRS